VPKRKNMKNIFIILSIIVLFYSSCDETVTPPSNKFVIEAFLFAGEPVDDIYIKTTFPISEKEDISKPIGDAIVTLFKEGIAYHLVPSDSVGFYHYPDSNLTVETGDVFQLEVKYNEIVATAQTIVPTPTTGVTASPDTLFYPTLILQGATQQQTDSINGILASLRMSATWDNPNDDYYYMTVESIENPALPLFPSIALSFLERFKYVSEPINGNSLSILGVGLTSLGTHKVKVYHINQEYVDLFLNQEQDSRDLNEPPTNIKGALGVFSAFNSGQAFFETAKL
jgi:hypothetical protein